MKFLFSLMVAAAVIAGFAIGCGKGQQPSRPNVAPALESVATPGAAPAVTYAPLTGPRPTPPGSKSATPAAAVIYTCPMHPEVVSNKPGKCPTCGMPLIVKK